MGDKGQRWAFTLLPAHSNTNSSGYIRYSVGARIEMYESYKDEKIGALPWRGHCWGQCNQLASWSRTAQEWRSTKQTEFQTAERALPSLGQTLSNPHSLWESHLTFWKPLPLRDSMPNQGEITQISPTEELSVKLGKWLLPGRLIIINEFIYLAIRGKGHPQLFLCFSNQVS